MSTRKLPAFRNRTILKAMHSYWNQRCQWAGRPAGRREPGRAEPGPENPGPRALRAQTGLNILI